MCSGVEDVCDFSKILSETAEDCTENQKPPYICNVCNIKVSSLKIFQRHLDGKKHLSRVDRQGKDFTCELCEIIANSQNQLDVHLRSSKHKARVARKEHMEFMLVSGSKGLWIIIFAVFCVFLNVLILFEVIY